MSSPPLEITITNHNSALKTGLLTGVGNTCVELFKHYEEVLRVTHPGLLPEGFYIEAIIKPGIIITERRADNEYSTSESGEVFGQKLSILNKRY